jgi:AcrR family transcriptional regulator
MLEIATEAGISRQALYRLFPNRQSVADAVMQLRVEELVEKVLPIALASESFSAALLDGAMEAITFVRSTPDLRRLLHETRLDQASSTLLRPSTTLRDLSASIWQPLLDRARARDEIRPGLKDADLLEWISTINLVYSARDDIDLNRLRVLLGDYLVPSIAR